MNKDQQAAVEIAIHGHNLLLTGTAGTGKSFVLKKIYSTLKNQGKNVYMTCTTGVACSVYPTGMATTVHRYAGLLDGRYSSTEIKAVLSNNRKFDEVVDRIKKTDTLIIDECSMLSCRTFEILNSACQLKDPAKYFGGMQVILCGDFLQLPPVANNLYQDDGSYCFQSSFFNQVIPHKIVLSQIFRQSVTEINLRNVINEVSKGKLSGPSSTQFLKSLSRPLPATDSQSYETTLFSTNEQVDSFNRQKILEMPGQLYEFKSSDTGMKKYLDRLTTQKVLWLKIGMPVILLRNLSDSLYNGLKGTIHDITKEGPSVEFPNGIVQIPRTAFDVFSPTANANIATRVQYPLKPAFGITIHKAQGMSLDRVRVDCQQIFKPGQLGVALSRATSEHGLQVINFDPKYCIQQPQCVTDFISHEMLPINDDMSCCRGDTIRSVAKDQLQLESQQNTTSSASDEIDLVEDLLDNELDDEFDELIKMISEEDIDDDSEIPQNFTLAEMLNSLKLKNVTTEYQVKVNQILESISFHKLTQFVKRQFNKMKEFFNKLEIDELNPKAIPNKVLTAFCENVHKYTTSNEYRMQCLLLFENDSNFSHEHMHVCYNIVSEIRKYLMKEKVNLFQISKKNTVERKITNASRARIRYVGGYCVNKIRGHYLKETKRYMYSTSAEGQLLYEEAEKSLHILNCLREEESNVMASTKEPDSLIDIARRQNLQRGLTNISDDLFHFFTELTDLCLNAFIGENLIRYGEHVFDKCYSKIIRSEKIHNMFVEIISKATVIESSSFLMKTQSDDENIPAILNRLVVYAAQTNEIFDAIVKKYMMVFLAQFRKDIKTAYKVSKTMAHRKQIKVSKPYDGKKQKKDAETPGPSHSTEETIQEPVASTSTASAELVLCKVCQLDHEDDDWIQCDKCAMWFHRICAGLKNSRWWKKYSAEGAQWFCKGCKN